MGRFSTQYETRSLTVRMLLCIPHGLGLSLLHVPPSHLKISEYAASDLSLSPCGKRPQLGAMFLADTCCNIWIHDSHLLAEECAAIRVILV